MSPKFFRKKEQKKKLHPFDRQHYRRALAKHHAMGVVLVRPGNNPIHGEIHDLSAGGAAVRFAAGSEPLIDEGDPVLLRFSSLVRGSVVEAQATNVRTWEESGYVCFGFAFTEPASVFDQLDSYFLKFFNRRRFVRVRPALGTRLRMWIEAGDHELEVEVHDISRSGVGFVVDQQTADFLGAVGTLSVGFKIPQTNYEFKSSAETRFTAPFSKGVRVGIELVDPDATMKKELHALYEYLAEREEDIARWE